MIKKSIKNKGFTLVEIIIAIGLAMIFLPAIGTLFSLSLKSSSQGEKFTQAYSLAQEGMEEIFYEKTNWLWTDTNPSNDIVINTLANNFTRKIEIAKACRDASNNLSDCSLGTIEDIESRKIIITVSWLEGTPPPQEVKLEAYVTKH